MMHGTYYPCYCAKGTGDPDCGGRPCVSLRYRAALRKKPVNKNKGGRVKVPTVRVGRVPVTAKVDAGYFQKFKRMV